MEIRFLTDTDYDNTLVKWWEDWRWTAPLKECLPENGTCGMMVTSNGVEVCAGFVYFTNSKMAWVEYIISNKEYRGEDRSDCIEFLINTLCELVKDKGFSYIYASIKNNHLVKKYNNCGFISGDSNCQEMIKII